MNEHARHNIKWPVDPETAPLNPSYRKRGFMYCPEITDTSLTSIVIATTQLVGAAAIGGVLGCAIFTIVSRFL